MGKNKYILIYPDYGNAIFWVEDGNCIGGYSYLFLNENNEIDLSSIQELKDWFLDWESESLYHSNNWNDTQWKEWWSRGYEISKSVKALLGASVELYYFSLKDPIWRVRPIDSNDGGLFNVGEPIKVE